MSNWTDAVQDVIVDNVYIYPQVWNDKGWIAGLTVCDEDNGVNYFYGPDVLNIKVFTSIEAKDEYDPEGIFDYPVVQKHLNTYSTYFSYKTYVILDESIRTEDNKDDFDEFHMKLTTICEKLINFGFEYLGLVNSQDINIEPYLENLIKTYYSTRTN